MHTKMTLTTSLFPVLLLTLLIAIPCISQEEQDIPFSFVFIIDNSGSNSGFDGTDKIGERFSVTKDLIDYMYQKNPMTKIGLVIFGSRLWFYGPDDTALFVSVPKDQYDNGDGCYIPPLNLNETYSGTMHSQKSSPVDYTLTGIDVLKLYLETKVDGSVMGGEGVVPKYTPTHQIIFPQIGTTHSLRLTNITRAIDAANQAHLYQTPQLEKSKHINIFLSDGKAALDAKSPDYFHTDDYIKGENTASTITYFYNSMATDLEKLETMTQNIKANGYSEKNSEYTELVALSSWSVIEEKIKALYDGLPTPKGAFLNSQKRDPINIKIVSQNKYLISSSNKNLKIDIYNTLGQKIRSLTSERSQSSQIIWDADDSNFKIPAGKYFLKIQSGDHQFSRAVTVLF